MKKLLLFLLVCLAQPTFSQTIAAFTKTKDRIIAGKDKAVEYTISVKIPDATRFKNYKVTVALDKDKTTVPIDSIYLPANMSFVISDKNEAGIKIKFNRDEKDDQTIVFKLSAVDDKEVAADLKTTDVATQILVKPLTTEAINKDDNFWLYTGTNIDFLDGVKPKELYFKASYLVNIKNDNKATKHWLYITGGKNRYSSANDSLSKVSYSDLDISKYNKDSVYIKSGFYRSVFEQVTDNIYTSFDYLYELNRSDDAKIFFTGGFYIGYQSIKMTYKNTVLTTNNMAIPVSARPTFLYPIVPNNTKHQVNYNLSVGFIYKLTNDTYDIKAQVNGGYNRFFYPYFRRETVQGIDEELTGKNNAFLQLRLEGTVLNPGLSLGIETLIRSGTVPLFNVSLTKVLTLKQIGSLFGKTGQ